MTVKRIIPCVCCEHPPSVDDCSDYGMPVLTPHNGYKDNVQFWVVKCPKCGRGGCIEYKSPYLALKHWNEMQVSLYAYENKPILYSEDFKLTCERLGYEYIRFGEQLSLGLDDTIEEETDGA